MKRPIVEKVALYFRRCSGCNCRIRPGESFYARLGDQNPAWCAECRP